MSTSEKYAKMLTDILAYYQNVNLEKDSTKYTFIKMCDLRSKPSCLRVALKKGSIILLNTNTPTALITLDNCQKLNIPAPTMVLPLRHFQQHTAQACWLLGAQIGEIYSHSGTIPNAVVMPLHDFVLSTLENGPHSIAPEKQLDVFEDAAQEVKRELDKMLKKVKRNTRILRRYIKSQETYQSSQG